jgi:hypothetical protein
MAKSADFKVSLKFAEITIQCFSEYLELLMMRQSESQGDQDPASAQFPAEWESAVMVPHWSLSGAKNLYLRIIYAIGRRRPTYILFYQGRGGYERHIAGVLKPRDLRVHRTHSQRPIQRRS